MGNMKQQPRHLCPRAENSGISLTAADAALAKAMLARGDRQHDVGAFFGVNPGRIAEIATGQKFALIEPLRNKELPDSGPYLSPRSLAAVQKLLADASASLSRAEAFLPRKSV